jgi:hypothetical protein
LRVSRDGQEREQGSEDNPNVHAHQGKPRDAWEVLALRSAALLTRACPPAIAYSRVDTGRTPSAVPSSSNFPASHLGSQLGLIAHSYRAFSSPPLGRPTRLPGQANLLPPSPPAEKATAELMLYLERAASALDVLTLTAPLLRPFAVDVGV